MSQAFETPDGWEQHPYLAKSQGFLDAFRTPDHSAFVDIIEYKSHMEPDYVVKFVVPASPDSTHTTTVEERDCDGEKEAWNTAIEFMEDYDA